MPALLRFGWNNGEKCLVTYTGATNAAANSNLITRLGLMETYRRYVVVTQ
ncbi:hypothetical protein UFOVP889_4 [uncultured Caudovirales phage]|uniref:Uncharacterized protein n=1 Tax=uncultured Caudovirales phage TaxID=2100421 RepID=A0A6J5RJX9_9CAUD|nr:hypothetical protein UFOVP889_4 [uncultured Caudovirales phage]CAB4194636.1 hypothetical protein UFOVP1283_5 [uncultured Caudovirales phage]